MRRTGVKLGGSPFQTILHVSLLVVETMIGKTFRRKNVFVVEKTVLRHRKNFFDIDKGSVDITVCGKQK